MSAEGAAKLEPALALRQARSLRRRWQPTRPGGTGAFPCSIVERARPAPARSPTPPAIPSAPSDLAPVAGVGASRPEEAEASRERGGRRRPGGAPVAVPDHLAEVARSWRPSHRAATSASIMLHFTGGGLDDERYVVQRFVSRSNVQHRRGRGGGVREQGPAALAGDGRSAGRGGEAATGARRDHHRHRGEAAELGRADVGLLRGRRSHAAAAPLSGARACPGPRSGGRPPSGIRIRAGRTADGHTRTPTSLARRTASGIAGAPGNGSPPGCCPRCGRARAPAPERSGVRGHARPGIQPPPPAPATRGCGPRESRSRDPAKARDP